MIKLLELKRTTQFKKDLKRVIKRGLPITELDAVIINLRSKTICSDPSVVKNVDLPVYLHINKR